MTPSKIGEMTVPVIDSTKIAKHNNINMISCGGQVSVPLAYTIGKLYNNIDYLEVVSSIASKSAGPATRINIDEYIYTTELALKKYSGSKETKVILILKNMLKS